MIYKVVTSILIAGVLPLTGLYSAFPWGLITGMLGGRPRKISGVAGIFAVVIISLVIRQGVELPSRGWL